MVKPPPPPPPPPCLAVEVAAVVPLPPPPPPPIAYIRHIVNGNEGLAHEKKPPPAVVNTSICGEEPDPGGPGGPGGPGSPVPPGPEGPAFMMETDGLVGSTTIICVRETTLISEPLMGLLSQYYSVPPESLLDLLVPEWSLPSRLAVALARLSRILASRSSRVVRAFRSGSLILLDSSLI